MLFKVANVVGFQAVWFASVYGAGADLPWLGPLAAGLFASLHLQFSPERQSDLRLLATAIVLGFLVDSVFAASQLLHYAAPWPWNFAAPLWIVAMWAGFALTLNHSMAFLRGRWVLAALFGLVGGPLAYWSAGRAFSAVTMAEPMIALAMVGAAWAAALPLLYRFSPAAADKESA